MYICYVDKIPKDYYMLLYLTDLPLTLKICKIRLKSLPIKQKDEKFTSQR